MSVVTTKYEIIEVATTAAMQTEITNRVNTRTFEMFAVRVDSIGVVTYTLVFSYQG